MNTESNDTESNWLNLPEFMPDPTTRPGFILTQLILALNTAFIFLGSFSSVVCVALSAAWLIARVFCVAVKPLDELVTHLGFDVPQGPRVDLAAVKADGITIHWKPADDRKTSTQYEVQVNGIICGKVSPLDNSLVLSNLKPSTNYVVRIIAINSHDFKAASEPLRLRTKSASSNDFYTSQQSTAEQKEGGILPTGPTITPQKNLPDTLASPIAATPMAREISNGPSVIKRVPTPRRPSPAMYIAELHANSSADDLAATSGLEATQHQLTERLEEIGKEIAEVEKQVVEEEQEAEQAKVEQVRERDELRVALKEKENASKDLRKKVSAAERENATAQNKKAAQDRQLQQKISEKRKVKDDTERWIRESKEMLNYVEECATLKTEYLADIERQKNDFHQTVAHDAQALKQLEDEVKEKSQEVKKLEREKSNSPASGDDPHHDYHREDDEEDRQFEEYMARMEEEYRLAHMSLEEAKMTCDGAYRAVQEAYERSRRLAFMNAPPITTLAPISRADSTRQRRGLSDQFVTSPTAPIGFAMSSAAPFSNGMDATAPHDAFATNRAPFFNIMNGMPLGPPEHLGLSPAEVERLTGGALMSPSAGADLLPADLLSNADEDPPEIPIAPPPGLSEPRQGSTGPILQGLGAFGGSSVLPGLGASNFADTSNQGPQSPASASSRSPSIFASPLASASNLPFYSPEPARDIDGRSIRSGRSIRPASGGTGPQSSRFAQILGLDKFNRQRGKTWTNDELALGRLQSQSMPKEAPQDDPPGMKRRNSSHSGNFFGNFKTGFGSSLTKPDGASSIEESKPRPPRRPFMGFGGMNGWGFGSENTRPASPGSTHSNELARPQDNRSSWSSWQTNETPITRQSPLGVDWSQPQTRNWGSRYPSRRPSAQIGPSSGVAFDIAEADDDVYDDDDSTSAPHPRPTIQAPIGTKPAAPIERPITPIAALNPAAKDFKSLFQFGGGESSSSASKKEKAKSRKDAASGGDPNALTPVSSTQSPFLGGGDDTSSPPQSRKSRDSRSVMTAESSAADAASSSTRPSLDRTPSHSLLDVATPTSSVAGSVGGKTGGFMQRLGRKSSSGKFALPVFQKRGRDKDKGVVEEGVEDGMSGSTGSLLEEHNSGESKGGKDENLGRGKRTWSTGFLGFGKGKEKEKAAREERVGRESEDTAGGSEVDGGGELEERT